MSTKKIIRLGPYSEPATDPGTTVLSLWDPRAIKATHIFPNGPRVVWPFTGAVVGPKGPEDAALRYLATRDYVSTIYVVGDSDAPGGPYKKRVQV
jgi:hypothetical protein